jgi:hypothetical protein
MKSAAVAPEGGAGPGVVADGAALALASEEQASSSAAAAAGAATGIFSSGGGMSARAAAAAGVACAQGRSSVHAAHTGSGAGEGAC